MALNRRYEKKHAILLLLGCFFIIDRLLKTIALNLTSAKPLLGDWFMFSFSQNTDLAFSLPTKIDPLWFMIPILVGAFIWLYFSFRKNNKNEIIALTAIILGALSNLYDRIVYGAVIDYFELFKLNVSNLADWLVVGGAIWLVYSEFLKKKKNQ